LDINSTRTVTRSKLFYCLWPDKQSYNFVNNNGETNDQHCDGHQFYIRDQFAFTCPADHDAKSAGHCKDNPQRIFFNGSKEFAFGAENAQGNEQNQKTAEQYRQMQFPSGIVSKKVEVVHYGVSFF
jgi:hypothetical protein